MRLRFFSIITILILLVGCSTSTSSKNDDENIASIGNETDLPEQITVTYTIDFYKGTEVLDSKEVVSGERVERPENPTDLENSRFVGWYETPNFTKRFIFSKAITNNMNLYARFINISYVPIGEETTVEEIENSAVFISGRGITIPSLYVCDHEVTQAEWSEYMKVPSGLAKTGDNYPIHKINWYECIMYCNLRSEAEGLVPAYYVTVDGEDVYDVATWMSLDEEHIDADENDKFFYKSNTYSNFLDAMQCNINANGYRIPTEAEWEFFARANNEVTNKVSSNGVTYATYDPVGDYAWYKDNTSTVHEVKEKINGGGTLGIYDILGNVSEMCFDRFDEIDINTPITGANAFDENGNNRRLKCVRRGGCYTNQEYSEDSADSRKYPTGCNVDTRGQPKTPYDKNNYGGLRVVCTAN